MKLDFNQRAYQEQAIESVMSLFDGQPSFNQNMDISISHSTDYLFKNYLNIDKEIILENLNKVQDSNNRKEAPIDKTDDLVNLDFSIEMETGTGKTFVYLKTIAKLAKEFGWNKYVIVVPSIAIREGIKSEFERLKKYIEDISGKNINLINYDSSNLTELEAFNHSMMVEILLMTMQSFNSDSNILHKESYDSDYDKPINLIKEVNPIVILDEPQKMEGEATQEKLKEFSSLFTLRYSATHKDIKNLIYRYTPIDAYQDEFVKNIEVLSIYGNKETDVKAYIEVLEIGNDAKGEIYAKIKHYKSVESGVKIANKTIKGNKIFDLYQESKEMSEYKDYVVKKISVTDKILEFNNGVILKENEVSQNKNDIMKIQIKETIKAHLDKEKMFYKYYHNRKEVKVLSLFFIDKVINFRDYSQEDGKGKILVWFEEAYNELTNRPEYSVFRTNDIDKISISYFSQDKGGYIDTKGNKKKIDEESYNKIMRDKEHLLSFDSPERFVFTHSALREGWDNPNVFQICTLNESKSDVRKRQEIGRGLRLPVNLKGKRIRDKEINILTVIANESYDTFARELQKQLEEDTGLKNAAEMTKNSRAKATTRLFESSLKQADFLDLWNKINKKTNYHIDISEAEIINNTLNYINSYGFKVEQKKITITNTVIKDLTDVEKFKEQTNYEKGETIRVNRVPNVVKRIADYTGLTKKVVIEIIKKASIERQILIQPEDFIEKFVFIIRKIMPEMFVERIVYKFNNQEYTTRDFKEELTFYKDKYYQGELDTERTMYDSVAVDSEAELEILNKLNSNKEKIKFFFKLPNWFKIPTPVGNYNPDWAIVLSNDEEEKLYLIRESKFTEDATVNTDKIKKNEKLKIQFGKKHFDSIAVDYQVIQKFEDLFDKKARGSFQFEKNEIKVKEAALTEREQLLETLKKFKNISTDFDVALSVFKLDILTFNITEGEFDLL